MPCSPTASRIASLCHFSSSGWVSTIKAGLVRRRRSSSDNVNEVFWAEVLKGKVLVTIGPERRVSRLCYSRYLSLVPRQMTPDATELAEPLRLVDVEEVPP